MTTISYFFEGAIRSFALRDLPLALAFLGAPEARIAVTAAAVEEFMRAT